MPLIYRNAGAWGPGKGARLTSLEADGNVYDLDSRLRNVELNPPAAVSIDHFGVSGNALTIFLTNGATQGPFTLPSAQWRWAGEWQALATYYALDVITYAGSVYLVRHNHTSDATFAADAEDATGFRYAAPIPGDQSVLLQHVATRSFVLPVGFADSTAYLLNPVSTENISLAIQKNADLIGHIEFNIGENPVTDGGQLGTFVSVSPPAEIQFSRTDRLTVLAPDVADATASALSITVAARTGII